MGESALLQSSAAKAFGGISGSTGYGGAPLRYETGRGIRHIREWRLNGNQRHRQVFLIWVPQEAATVQLSYDPRRNIAYLRLRELAGAQVETVRLSDELNVDLAPDGTVYGIELLNANEQLRGADGGVLVLIDEVAGRRTEVPLPELA
jgi:uncharacterized protein YuzE